MIIGAGPGQVPIIQKCKQRGLVTLVVSPQGPYPGISIADKHINEDIYNKDKLVEIGKTEGIDYVISDQSDYAVPIVAYIADKLNLNGNSVSVAETYTYKSKFRHFCRLNNIPSPKSITLSIDDNTLRQILSLKYTVVVKPSDSQGSRGISKIDNPSQLNLAINNAKKYSKNGSIVIEEFFCGREIVCEGFVIDGKYYNVAFGDRSYFSIPNVFIPSKTTFPSNLTDDIKNKIIETESIISSTLKPSFGIVHSEYLINEDGDFIIIESALRGGGVYIASHLIPYSTGIELTDILIDAMMGKKEDCHKKLIKKQSDSAEYLCFYLKEGVVTALPDVKNKISSIPGVQLSEIENIHVGDTIGKFEHKGMRKGPFIIKAKSFDILFEIENLIKERLVIEVSGENGVIWE